MPGELTGQSNELLITNFEFIGGDIILWRIVLTILGINIEPKCQISLICKKNLDYKVLRDLRNIV